jgi:predicted CopG family antitoxin
MSKLISVSDEVYETLKRQKNGKSFSEVIKSMYEKPVKTPFDVIKDWNPSPEFIEGLEKTYRERGKWKLKKVKF